MLSDPSLISGSVEFTIQMPWHAKHAILAYLKYFGASLGHMNLKNSTIVYLNLYGLPKDI